MSRIKLDQRTMYEQWCDFWGGVALAIVGFGFLAGVCFRYHDQIKALWDRQGQAAEAPFVGQQGANP
jgi:hypothetical protein